MGALEFVSPWITLPMDDVANKFYDIYFFLLNFSAPSSPVQNRRLLSARNARMSSIEMPDDNEKSVSSASTSPCHSPVSFYICTLKYSTGSKI